MGAEGGAGTAAGATAEGATGAAIAGGTPAVIDNSRMSAAVHARIRRRLATFGDPPNDGRPLARVPLPS